MTTSKTPVGGGFKKILYALNTLNTIGLKKASKALRANNTCKACGLGMGGQRGGMIDEQGVFPSVCNKSVQAQSTDIQAPIPDDIFAFSIDDFRELSPKELEHIGRLGKPIFKAAGSSNFTVVEWDWALKETASRFSQTSPERSFFYSSGRSSNEAGFILQLLARMYGTNNVNNCSYYCHQATGVGLTNSIGGGTSTVELEDLDKCDTLFLLGANPASNHPRLLYKLKACRERGGNVIVINPAKEPGLVKFAVPKSPKSLLSGGSEIATHYLQPNIGSDQTLLLGIAKSMIESQLQHSEFIEKFTQDFAVFKQSASEINWTEICEATGIAKKTIESIANIYAASENTIFAWGMGITHHNNGVNNVEAISNLALLGGHIGRPGAGLLPLRGHSNVQGIGTIGVKPVLPDDVFQNMKNYLGVTFPAGNHEKGLDTLACLESASNGDMDCALIMGGNLYQASPNSKWAASALDQINFKCYLTTTLNYGHIHGCDESDVLILPVCARDEEPGKTTQESMFNYVRLSDGGIKRIAQARSESHVLADLGALLLEPSSLDFSSFKDFDSTREAIANIVPGMQNLKDIAIARKEFHIANRILHIPTFNTPSGKARFITHLPQKNSDEPDFPLTLASVRSEGQFNSIIYETSDHYRNTQNRWAVLMNPIDIAKLDKVTGDTATIKSAIGEMRDVTIYAFDVAPGNVLAYYPEANQLIGLDRDPRSQTPAFKSVAVNIR